jgi:hypothetical protein
MVMKAGGVRHEGATCLEREKMSGKNGVSDDGNGEIEGEMQRGL